MATRAEGPRPARVTITGQRPISALEAQCHTDIHGEIRVGRNYLKCVASTSKKGGGGKRMIDENRQSRVRLKGAESETLKNYPAYPRLLPT